MSREDALRAAQDAREQRLDNEAQQQRAQQQQPVAAVYKGNATYQPLGGQPVTGSVVTTGAISAGEVVTTVDNQIDAIPRTRQDQPEEQFDYAPVFVLYAEQTSAQVDFWITSPDTDTLVLSIPRVYPPLQISATEQRSAQASGGFLEDLNFGVFYQWQNNSPLHLQVRPDVTLSISATTVLTNAEGEAITRYLGLYTAEVSVFETVPVFAPTETAQLSDSVVLNPSSPQTYRPGELLEIFHSCRADSNGDSGFASTDSTASATGQLIIEYPFRFQGFLSHNGQQPIVLIKHSLQDWFAGETAALFYSVGSSSEHRYINRFGIAPNASQIDFESGLPQTDPNDWRAAAVNAADLPAVSGSVQSLQDASCIDGYLYSDDVYIDQALQQIYQLPLEQQLSGGTLRQLLQQTNGPVQATLQVRNFSSTASTCTVDPPTTEQITIRSRGRGTVLGIIYAPQN